MEKNKIINGKVIKIIDSKTIIINKGSNDGVIKGDRFLIYNIGEEIIDPDTKESLGKLEIVCGEGKATHVQEKISTLKSSIIEQTSTSKKIIRNGMSNLFGSTEEIENPIYTTIDFIDAKEGSLIKKI